MLVESLYLSNIHDTMMSCLARSRTPVCASPRCPNSSGRTFRMGLLLRFSAMSLSVLLMPEQLVEAASTVWNFDTHSALNHALKRPLFAHNQQTLNARTAHARPVPSSFLVSSAKNQGLLEQQLCTLRMNC